MWKLFVILIFCVEMAVSYKILIVYSFPKKSHSILGYGMVKRLLEAGHEVTYMTAVLEDNSNPNLRQVNISENFNYFKGSDFLNIELLMKKESNMNDITKLYGKFLEITKATIANENFQKLINDRTQTFDLVIIEWMYSEILAGLSAVYDCPYIWFSSMEPHWQVLRLVDESPNPAYNVDILSFNTAPLTFLQRVTELYVQIRTTLYMNIYYDNLEKEAYEKGFSAAVSARGRQLPPWEVVKYNASLVLSNSHVSMGEPARLPQNFIPIGGYHIDDNIPALPKELQLLMDKTKHGVIYFSMGSNLKSKDLPEEIKRKLIKMFGKLKQTVLWKFEEQIPDMPKNIHVAKWFPQSSILAHPHCVLFITHGGLLSTTEAIHNKVAIIGIPAFADQFINVGKAVQKGFAVRVELSFNLAEDLEEAIREVLHNPKYKERVAELSWIYQHRPMRATAELSHWVEHVVRTRGAPHLRSPALAIPLYQKLYLDLLCLVFFFLFTVYVLFRKMLVILSMEKMQEGKKTN